MIHKTLNKKCAQALALLVLVLATACASMSGARRDGATAIADIYSSRCSACHPLRDPGRYNFEELDRALDKYAWRAGCTSDEKLQIREYFKKTAGTAE